MDELGKKLNIKNREEWQTVNKRTLEQNGGRGLLKYYNGSMHKLLASVFPEYLNIVIYLSATYTIGKFHL